MFIACLLAHFYESFIATMFKSYLLQRALIHTRVTMSSVDLELSTPTAVLAVLQLVCFTIHLHWEIDMNQTPYLLASGNICSFVKSLMQECRQGWEGSSFVGCLLHLINTLIFTLL